ncbi:gamma-glutamyltransferase family protein [Planotetraspora kaengkrachanensis]|uniref:Gamma-glutamyltransferase n=1 Tax=Planotetraspora kaengkrachanensis TaxID=575193 RepID=A0A8J3PS46_9ACTN|nr:gamma-glutamyltransferase [Planotetraspora kaengkrachanensis]GIG79862.1 gamma-glutamyltransferase [Planotetraspora kaengkrachanensis]
MSETRYALNGMVCTVDHLASAAGAAVLDRGGNAVDAAIAANAVLAVTSPHMCGLGGDLFALVHDGSSAHALNASGRSGSGADPDRLRAEGHDRMPHLYDIRSVPVPGCVDGWSALHERFGRLPLSDILAPAIRHATTGFPASPLLGPGGEFIGSLAGAGDFASARRAGDVIRRPGVARTLEAIASGGRAAFYQGEFGEGLLALGAGEYLPEDLAESNADWVEPIRAEAFGHRIWTVPPNSQGYLLLLALAILDKLDLPDDPDDPRWAHLLVESARAAGHDRLDVLYEGAAAPLDSADARRTLIDPERRTPLTEYTAPGDTTYLCVVDGDGMGVSLIQSNAAGFGSLLFEPATGINLHNRGIGFSLVPGHPAEYGPRRRPPHTLSPALITHQDGSLRSVIGTMGGDAQPQILLQLVTRLLRHGQTPGQVIGAPRWALGVDGADTGFDTWRQEAVVEVEDGAPWSDGLRGFGHPVTAVEYGSNFGHAHLIDVLPSGVLAGAADPRALIGAAVGR